jgi:hypothetical protein
MKTANLDNDLPLFSGRHVPVREASMSKEEAGRLEEVRQACSLYGWDNVRPEFFCAPPIPQTVQTVEGLRILADKVKPIFDYMVVEMIIPRFMKTSPGLLFSPVPAEGAVSYTAGGVKEEDSINNRIEKNERNLHLQGKTNIQGRMAGHVREIFDPVRGFLSFDRLEDLLDFADFMSRFKLSGADAAMLSEKFSNPEWKMPPLEFKLEPATCFENDFIFSNVSREHRERWWFLHWLKQEERFTEYQGAKVYMSLPTPIGGFITTELALHLNEYTDIYDVTHFMYDFNRMREIGKEHMSPLYKCMKEENLSEESFSELIRHMLRSRHIHALEAYNKRVPENALKIGCDEGLTHKSRDFYHGLDGKESDISMKSIARVLNYIGNIIFTKKADGTGRAAVEKILASALNIR